MNNDETLKTIEETVLPMQDADDQNQTNRSKNDVDMRLVSQIGPDSQKEKISESMLKALKAASEFGQMPDIDHFEEDEYGAIQGVNKDGYPVMIMSKKTYEQIMKTDLDAEFDANK